MAGWNERDARFDIRPEPESFMHWDEALLVRIEQLIGALKVDSKEEPAPSRSLRILYADDNPINQRVAGEMLRKAGHRVDIVASGAEALTAMDDGSYDVVLMDVQMPDFDGCNATAAIRARERHTGAHTPILGVTAYSTPADETRCLEAGMDAYVAKPISEQSLLSSLRQLAQADTAVESEESFDDGIALDARAILSPDIAALLLNEYTHHLANIRSALGAGDLPHVERLAHRLKGAVGLFHAAHAYDAADRLEQIASTGDIAETTAIWKRLGGELERLIVELGGTAAPESDRP
jgi:two-component system sensor histidine kinase/response regulator